MGLLDEIKKLKKNQSPEQKAKVIAKHLEELEEAFEGKNLSIIDYTIKTKSKLIKSDGESIFEKSGLKGMQEVYKIVLAETNHATAANLSTIWDGTGDWKD